MDLLINELHIKWLEEHAEEVAEAVMGAVNVGANVQVVNLNISS